MCTAQDDAITSAQTSRAMATPTPPTNATASTPSASSTATTTPHPPRTTDPGPGRTGPVPARLPGGQGPRRRSEEHTSELQSRGHLVCRLLLEKKKIRPKIELISNHQISIGYQG